MRHRQSLDVMRHRRQLGVDHLDVRQGHRHRQVVDRQGADQDVRLMRKDCCPLGVPLDVGYPCLG
jgi:hypothetical protein